MSFLPLPPTYKLIQLSDFPPGLPLNLSILFRHIPKRVLNRFVREISYFVIGAVFIGSENIFEDEENCPRFLKFCDKLVPIVAQGLSDNWSQVRYASSQAVR